MNQRVSLSATCAVSLCFVDIASVVRQILNRAVCGVRSFHIHGSVRPTTAWKYTNWRQAFFASPIRCKSIRNLPLKLYCVFLALCVCCQNPSRRRTASGRGRMLTPYYHVARPSPLLNVSSCKWASASNASRVYKNAPFCFMYTVRFTHVQPLQVRWLLWLFLPIVDPFEVIWPFCTPWKGGFQSFALFLWRSFLGHILETER